jgi:hypothetical protein
MNARRQTAETAKPLSIEERRALVAELSKTASPKVKRGLAMIDFREPSPEEKVWAAKVGKSLEERGRQALARARQERAA